MEQHPTNVLYGWVPCSGGGENFPSPPTPHWCHWKLHCRVFPFRAVEGCQSPPWYSSPPLISLSTTSLPNPPAPSAVSLVHSSLRRREVYRYSSLNPRWRISILHTKAKAEGGLWKFFGGGNDILFIDRVNITYWLKYPHFKQNLS